MSDTPTEAKNAQTAYMILEADSDADGYWREADTIQARSVQEALRKRGKHGRFIAVPARSWKPVTVAAETKTILKLS